MVYGLAALDNSGRIADRAIIRALGWGPGTRLHIREGSGVIVVRLDRQGVFTVTGQGHLHLPAPARHWCGLTAGDRVFLSANPVDGLLVVYPPAALDAMVVAVHADLLRGGEA
ncbi:AbrB/MazE/SpoVT family DNA-binding domain-containing protein [Micromonospora sp. GCM10011542]|uniref:AbrB/MazE/SpoVT family DNA-binding domain-containing protein n=1 Tax=Micromonospora sp. GCM10011542 TaxID=3317337 RepID=UPI00360F9581